MGIILIIYGILSLIWLNQFWRKYWWGGGLLIVSLIFVPIAYQNLTLVQVTVLSAKSEPIVVIQDRGKASLINLGDEQTIKYTILPFLAQQGINHLTRVVTFNSQAIQDWIFLNPYVSVDKFVYSVGKKQPNSQKISVNKKLKLGSTSIQILDNNPPLINFQVNQQSWLWLTDDSISQNSLKNETIIPSQIILWSGNNISLNWVKQINPQVAISASSFIPKTVRQELQKQGIKLYWTRQNGAIQWTPRQGFKTTLIQTENNIF